MQTPVPDARHWAESRTRIVGDLMGVRSSRRSDVDREEVIWVSSKGRPNGPAEKAVVLVETRSDVRGRRGRYLSWKEGYEDLDRAAAFEPGLWRLVEPAEPYDKQVDWQPYGWESLEPVWIRASVHQQNSPP